MDSDDYLDLHLCEDVYAEAKAQDADLVFYDFLYVEEEQEYPVELIGREEIDLWYSHCGWAVWMQMVKRDIILEKSLFFPDNVSAADDAVVHLWKYYAKKRIKMQRPYYYYVFRKGSLSNETKLSSLTSLITGVIPYRYQIMRENGLLDKYVARSDLMIARDICTVLIKLLKSDKYLNMDNILLVRRELDFLDGHILDESLIKYALQQAELNMVNDFLHNTEFFLEKYQDYASFQKMRIEQGLNKSIEWEIRESLTNLQQKYGPHIAVWGAGAKGAPAIATLMRMGYDFQVFDNAKHGREIWENAGKHIHSFQEFEKLKIDVVLVTSDFYFKAIQNQINEKYPEIAVFNFMRLIRNLANK